jgi:hypothetical protein
MSSGIEQRILNALDNVGPTPKPLVRFLDLVGDGSGAFQNTSNHSGQAFKIVPGANEVFRIQRLIWRVSDSGTIQGNTYGALTALTNGFKFFLQNSGATISDLTAQSTIKTNAGWGAYAYDVAFHDQFAGGPKHVSARWTFTKFNPGGIQLDGSRGDKLVILCQDSMEGLEEHTFCAEGYYES